MRTTWITRTKLALTLAAMTTTIASAQAPEPNFTPQTLDDSVEIGYGVAVGDVNGNGRTDILLADKREIVWYRNPGERGGEWERFVMAANLTGADNVCIAARDINGDGQVEVAVGAQWNPGETEDTARSGAVFYLHRPEDPTQQWEAKQIEPHHPTTHRMRWMKVGEGEFRLAVLPLHGIGNQGGEGDPVRLQLVTPPDDLAGGEWESEFVDTGLNMTHNLDVLGGPRFTPEIALVVGRQGIVAVNAREAAAQPNDAFRNAGGEVRTGMAADWMLLATIEPMHGTSVVAYSGAADADGPTRHVLDDTLNAGHALGIADFLGHDFPQVVAGWRMPDDNNEVGIRMYVPVDESGENWETHTIDDNKMAAEDLQIADFDDDGKLDIVASGRATQNLIIYWNDSGE